MLSALKFWNWGWPVITWRRHELVVHELFDSAAREREGLGQEHTAEVSRIMATFEKHNADVFSTFTELLAARNQVLALTAENCQQWRELIGQLECPGCGKPAARLELYHWRTGDLNPLMNLTDVGLRAKCRCGKSWNIVVDRCVRNV